MDPTAQPSSAASRRSRRATIEEWLAIPEEQRAELIDGRIVYQGMPGPAHGDAQGGVIAAVRSAYHHRRSSADRPGGWRILPEVDLYIGGMGCRPDIAGWRRDEQPERPQPDARGVVTKAPSWVCEVLSSSTARTDTGSKRLGYHRAEVEYYWLLDLQHETLTVLRWTRDGYLITLVAGRGEKVRAAPFEAIEIDVSELLGDEAEPPEVDPPPAP